MPPTTAGGGVRMPVYRAGWSPSTTVLGHSDAQEGQAASILVSQTGLKNGYSALYLQLYPIAGLQGASYCRRLPLCSGQSACGPYAETTVRGACWHKIHLTAVDGLIGKAVTKLVEKRGVLESNHRPNGTHWKSEISLGLFWISEGAIGKLRQSGGNSKFTHN
eukprot:COSAG01_NODE_7769_length_3065_cov_5.482805_3_plen_163_part_00